MSVVTERPLLYKVRSFVRQARLASVAHETLEITPDMAGLLADYLRDVLEAIEDQAWFWTEEWQAGEREAESDLATGRYQSFDTMEALIDDLGWPR
jgi:beta-mannanase